MSQGDSLQFASLSVIVVLSKLNIQLDKSFQKFSRLRVP